MSHRWPAFQNIVRRFLRQGASACCFHAQCHASLVLWRVALTRHRRNRSRSREVLRIDGASTEGCSSMPT